MKLIKILKEIQIKTDKPDAIGKTSSGEILEFKVDNKNELMCYNNNLILLKILNPNKIKGLYCYKNELTSLDVSKCVDLKVLDCANNKIISLDIYNNPNLKELYCNGNELISLDISKNLNLDVLDYDEDEVKLIEEPINEIKVEPSGLIPGKKYWVYTLPTWEYLEFEKEFGNDKDNIRVLFKTDNGSYHVGKQSLFKNKEISFSKEKPDYEPNRKLNSLKEIKIQPKFNFNNLNILIGTTKVETDFFMSNYDIQLIDLGSYYSFVPYYSQTFVVLVPKKYIEIKKDKQHLKYSDEISQKNMDDVKDLILKNKTVTVQLVKNINEIKVEPSGLIPGKKYWVNIGFGWKISEFIGQENNLEYHPWKVGLFFKDLENDEIVNLDKNHKDSKKRIQPYNGPDSKPNFLKEIKVQPVPNFAKLLVKLANEGKFNAYLINSGDLRINSSQDEKINLMSIYLGLNKKEIKENWYEIGAQYIKLIGDNFEQIKKDMQK